VERSERCPPVYLGAIDALVHPPRQRLDHDRGKQSTIFAVAVARELTGFCWAAANAD
jgi:hypothetical protein